MRSLSGESTGHTFFFADSEVRRKVSRDIFTRDGFIPPLAGEHITVIGCGGVGSWVGFFAGLMGCESLVLVDPDTVEMSNLNRTPFKLSHAEKGIPKVAAIKELILERRPPFNISTIENNYEGVDPVALVGTGGSVVIDCRDSGVGLLPEVWALADPRRITGGYDGVKISIQINPDKVHTFNSHGEAADHVRYTITPSSLLPPVKIARDILEFIKHSREIGERYHLNPDDPMVVTLDSFEMLAFELGLRPKT